MPLIATRGAASAQGFGEFAQSAAPNYIEDVFSTYLYTGNGSTQTITNGIDLSTKGGLVWLKQRSAAGGGSGSIHLLSDTARGITNTLCTNNTLAQNLSSTNTISSVSSSGFSLVNNADSNLSSQPYASWTFRKQPKFFDVVTYTGNAAVRTIAHSLGSVPGSIWIKRTDSTSNWAVYHKDLGVDQGYTGKDFHIFLNLTNAQDGISDYWNNTAPTSTVFSLGANAAVNTNGATYVAYLFAHNAGGFGLTGTDNVISCGSYTGTSDYEGPVVNLGFEPQWLLIKSAGSVKNWVVLDNMRGLTAGGDNEGYLVPNTSDQEYSGTLVKVNATGFQANGSSMTGSNGVPYIYIAIRRGPMKVPTSGTSVFTPIAASNATNTQNTTDFPVDLQIQKWRSGVLGDYVFDRLRGISSVPSTTSITTGPYLRTSALDAEISVDDLGYLYDNTSFRTGSGWNVASVAYWNFKRAPSFFDEVCYTGNRVSGSTTQTLTHNLGATPELMIVKGRSTSYDWFVYSAALGATKYLSLRSTIAAQTTVNPNAYWNETAPTSTQFTVGANNNINGSGVTFVAYLFATCAGVSKVGSYTGTGATQTISCGFSGGARFVLVKRTDSTGDWYVWDTARGMVSGTDPSLLLNSTAAEVNANSIYTTTGGFQIVSTAAGINASGGTYIYLAIA